jgi:hypothetical protein
MLALLCGTIVVSTKFSVESILGTAPTRSKTCLQPSLFQPSSVIAFIPFLNKLFLLCFLARNHADCLAGCNTLFPWGGCGLGIGLVCTLRCLLGQKVDLTETRQLLQQKGREYTDLTRKVSGNENHMGVFALFSEESTILILLLFADGVDIVYLFSVNK